MTKPGRSWIERRDEPVSMILISSHGFGRMTGDDDLDTS
jgi:hypothetical protein